MQSLQLDDGSETWIRILTKKKKKKCLDESETKGDGDYNASQTCPP